MLRSERLGNDFLLEHPSLPGLLTASRDLESY